MRAPRAMAVAAVALGAGCAVTPVTGKIEVGDEAFVVVVGEGSDGATDLFAAPAGAGSFVRLTFTRVAEERPRLSPLGTSVAFVRRFDDRRELVVLDLRSTGEQRAVLDGDAARIGWSPGADTVFVETATGLFAAGLDGSSLRLAPIPASDRARADSALAEQLGSPTFALIRPCRSGRGPCATVGDTLETPLGEDVTDPIRWGPGAVGYLRAGRIEVRPLGGGRPTHPNLTNPPSRLRQPTHHPGGRAAPGLLPADARIPPG